MNVKGKGRRLISSRTVLIILLVLCIIAAAYILITNYSGESEKVLSVKEVLSQSKELTGEITVKGYYYDNVNNNIIEITDSAEVPSSIPSEDKLLVDHSGVENVDLEEGNKYLFTGVLQEYTPNPNLVILIASKIEPS